MNSVPLANKRRLSSRVESGRSPLLIVRLFYTQVIYDLKRVVERSQTLSRICQIKILLIVYLPNRPLIGSFIFALDQ